MIYKFELTGETPAKKNSRINLKNGRSFPSKHYQSWHSSAMLELKRQIKIKESIKSPCTISITFVHGDLRRRDSDNATSSIFDLLVDSKILEDDKWQIVKSFTVSNEYEKGKAKCKIKIEVE